MRIAVSVAIRCELGLGTLLSHAGGQREDGKRRIAIVRLPEKGSAAVMSATVIESGAVTVDQCVEILTPAQMDAAVKQTASYRAPGR